MSIETDVYAALVGDSTFNGLVSGRVYPEPLPDNVTLPCAGYSLISDVPMASANSGSFNSYRVQVTLCADGYAATRTMRDAIQDIIDGKNNWQKENIGPDMFEDIGEKRYRYLPVDIIIIKGD